jgi:hypothetical protein
LPLHPLHPPQNPYAEYSAQQIANYPHNGPYFRTQPTAYDLHYSEYRTSKRAHTPNGETGDEIKRRQVKTGTAPVAGDEHEDAFVSDNEVAAPMAKNVQVAALATHEQAVAPVVKDEQDAPR